ncbi:MAG TPA: class I adenylate-forming enzyme family protein [Smithellaceae bacterium]|nr:class I adenylate-forming enzyme family protein [Smithellaceae bacterium]
MNVIKLALNYREKREAFTGLIFENKSFFNEEISSEARRFAEGLKDIGVKPGDIVATILPNCKEILTVYEGVLRCGGILLPIIFALTEPEITYILKDSEAKYIITSKELLDKIHNTIRLKAKIIVIGVDGVIAEDLIDYRFLVEKYADGNLITDRAGDDLAMIMYTSGTTGKPKGVMLTHDNFCASLECPFYEALNVEGGIVLITLPMNHVFGLAIWLYSYCKHGATIVLHRWFDPVKTLQDIEKFKISLVPLVPTMLLMILEEASKNTYDTSSVRFWFVAAAPFPPHKIKEVEERLGGIFIHDYGLTETMGDLSCQDPNGIRKLGSVGKPMPGMEVRIVDDNGNEVPRGEWGEITVRGWGVMKGYLNRPKETSEVLKGGFLYTGDIGYLDEDGDLFITDRKKNMILRGGENIYPLEIENALYKIKGISEVAVFGIPDPKYGEKVAACVVLKAGYHMTQDEIVSACLKYIPKYKCPKQIAFVKELPKTQTGKVDKKILLANANKIFSADNVKLT